MKKICAIILAMTVSIITYGQVSKTLVDDNKLWSNLFQNSKAGPPPHVMVTNYIKFSADTTIDDKIYKKVLESKDESTPKSRRGDFYKITFMFVCNLINDYILIN